jgi:RimJ/RimL family protein N-acetyltransferase
MLIGKLIRLRALEPADLEREYGWINDREVTQFLEMRYPASHEAERAWLEGQAKVSYDHLTLAIEVLDDGRHIGNIGFVEAKPEDRKGVLGIMIGDKDFWSRGYGTDAVLTVLRFGFDEMNLNRVMLHVHDSNARAIACYRKCGFVEEGRLRQDRFTAGAYQDTLVMGVLRGEFEALRGRTGAEP